MPHSPAISTPISCSSSPPFWCRKPLSFLPPRSHRPSLLTPSVTDGSCQRCPTSPTSSPTPPSFRSHPLPPLPSSHLPSIPSLPPALSPRQMLYHRNRLLLLH